MTKLYHEREAGWIVPGKQGRKAERIDVPNGPDELAAWLNARKVWPTAGLPLLVTVDVAEPSPPTVPERSPDAGANIADRTEHDPNAGRQARAAEQALASGDVDRIKDWIFDAATPWQIEHIFTALGVRFHEMRRKAEQGGQP